MTVSRMITTGSAVETARRWRTNRMRGLDGAPRDRRSISTDVSSKHHKFDAAHVMGGCDRNGQPVALSASGPASSRSSFEPARLPAGPVPARQGQECRPSTD